MVAKRGELIATKLEKVFLVDEKALDKDLEFTITKVIDAEKKICEVLAPSISPEAVKTYVPLVIINQLKSGAIVEGERYIAVFKGKQKAKNKGANGLINFYNNWEIYTVK
jgi:hypothetical protein